MGNRASVIIKQNKKQGIEIYGHWAGNNIVNTLPHALVLAKGRFDDISYFTQVFRKHQGMTPKEFIHRFACTKQTFDTKK